MRNHFKEYESRPVTRLAYQIKEDDTVTFVAESLYRLKLQAGLTIPFKAHEPVKVGDWVVYLTESDTYHCSDEVFRERNIV